ncbi:MAG: DUF1565 domain-containing protein, partial [Prolixibacteraceae bacterium]|nr:DUF1565 domain-containing protein [Prolixibacteraceae bacterium]
IKNNFWITYTLTNTNYSGILKSISGNASGPYTDVSGDEPLVKGANAALFEDTDKTVYFIWNGGQVHTMNDEMNGFSSSSPRKIQTQNEGNKPEGMVSVFRNGEKYFLISSQWNDIISGEPTGSPVPSSSENSRFDCLIASSNSFFGPYSKPWLSVPHGGGGMLFYDYEENIWATFSGYNDVSAPMYNTPAIILLDYDKENRLKPVINGYFHPTGETKIVYVSKEGNNKNGANWADAFTSLQTAIDQAKAGTQIWVSRGTYDAPVEIELRKGLYIYGGFRGDEQFISQRDTEKNKVIIDGRQRAYHVFSITNSSFIRIDGLTITNGNAKGRSFQDKYGAGIHILRGGETIRIVNCKFEGNRAEQDGGALYTSVGAAPLVINCTFSNNSAKKKGGAASLYCNAVNGYQAQFFHCNFENNLAMDDGGAIYFDTNQKNLGLLKLVNCVITNNQSFLSDGIIAVDRTGSLILSNCTVGNNRGAANGAVISGLGNVPGRSRIVNSIFYKNWGGSLFTIEGEAQVNRDNILTGDKNIWIRFSHCIFYENDTENLVERNFDGKSWITTSELNNSIMGNNLIEANPGFVNPDKGDFNLSSSSVARNKGTLSFAFQFDGKGKARNKNRLPDIGAN